MLAGKTVLLGVTGSIAAYKSVYLTRLLTGQHANVRVLMTQNAANFVNPITFETLTGSKCMIDTFDRGFEFAVEHVSAAKEADCVVIAPASANVIGKLAGGIADDMLTTTVMAASCPKLVAPAMNTGMYLNPIVQDNIKRLKGFGYIFIEPVTGLLACGDVGTGKMESEQTILDYVLREIAFKKDMAGLKVLVTAGPTREAIDHVRYITNHSTGKMGYALARAAMLRGAEVTLVSGPTSLPAVPFVKTIDIITAEDLYREVTAISDEQDIIIKAAAVADYRPAVVSPQKIKKGGDDLALTLVRTPDTLAELGKRKRPGQFLCGFSMETEDLAANSRAKLHKKGLDMIAANNLNVCGAGFGTDTNVVTLITEDSQEELPLESKERVAMDILDRIMDKRCRS